MDENLYDEFGNYIGPGLSGSEDGENSEGEGNEGNSNSYQQINTVSFRFLSYCQVQGAPEMQRQDGSSEMASENGGQTGGALMEVDEEDDYAYGHEIVLHEDKQYYPDPEKIFGKDVETLVMEEDAQPLT